MRSFFAAAFLWLLFTPLGVFCLAWAFLFGRCAEYPSALVALGFAAFTLGLAAMLGIVATGRVEPRVSIIDGGMTVRPDRRVDGLLFGSTIGAFLGMATYAIGVPMGMIDITVPSGDEKYLVIACAMAVPVGAVSLIQIIRRRGTSYVRMTVDGLSWATR